MPSMLYVPTDRECLPAIRSGVAECAALREQTGEEHAFLLVEHGSGAYSPRHAELSRSLGEQLRVPVLHLTAGRWRELSPLIVRAAGAGGTEQRELLRLLDPDRSAYGAGPNKAYLVAAALQVENLHRRDSDHLPDHREGRVAHPGTLESRVIGRTLRDVGPLANAGLVPDGQWSKHVYCTGSSMFGDAPLDRRDLRAAGEEFAIDLQRISHPSLSRNALRAKMRNYLVDEPQTRLDRDFLELDLSGRVEVGVSCVRQIFRELPEMPLPETLGCDYMGKNLLYQLGLPVVFHSRKMRHAYDETRKQQRDSSRAVGYALRDLRYLLLRRVWSAHNQHIRENLDVFMPANGLVDGDRYAASFEGCGSDIESAIAGAIPEFASIHRRAGRAADGELGDRLTAVADEAERRGPHLVAEVADGIRDYCRLVRWWPKLIEAACGIGGVAVRASAAPPS